METVTLTIDGRPVTAEKGKTVLQAAIESGIKIPYYCYHPGLGIDGSCRVCIVKIEKMAKLQTSCSTPVAEGMVVSTQTPDVVEARASVLEFLLVNHPLDCPVCDKGGECPLQDFAYSFGPNESRMEFPRRVFDGEGVRADVDFGPTLMLNRNRCILCTRCVRFMREVDTDAQISIVDRGYGSEIATFQEEGVHSLLSGNLMDVCPVGAITTKDYRFKSRPWDNPEAVDTICTLCEKGCNTTAWIKAKPEWAKGAQLIRTTPRFNPDVNGYWMCDIGRFDYRWIEGEERLQRPLLRSESGSLDPADWTNALARLASKPRGKATPLKRAKLLAPVLYPGNIYCAGANYTDHVAEMERAQGREPGPTMKERGEKPWHFIKTSRSSVVGPDTTVKLPSYSQAVDWEVELVAVIGRPAKDLPVEKALSCVAGYTIANDLSARDVMRREKNPPASPFYYDWVSQKCFDGACPLGPWIVPANEIPDPHRLGIKLWVGDELMQDSSTSQMIFNTAEQIAMLSSRVTLYPGDLILTGTPAGVGMGRKRFLKPGERVRLWIEGIGEFSHKVS